MQKPYLKRILFLVFFIFFFLSQSWASWFDGLPDDALIWLYNEANKTGNRPNIQIMAFDEVKVVIQFSEGTEGYYTYEDHGWWEDDEEQVFFQDQNPQDLIQAVWHENWVEVWHEGKPAYYWVQITDVDTIISEETLAGLLYLSGQWKRFDSKEAIIREIKAAVSLEDKATTERVLKDLIEFERVMTLRRKAFYSEKRGEKKAPLISSETPVASADRTSLRIMNRLVIPRIPFRPRLRSVVPAIKRDNGEGEGEEKEEESLEKDKVKLNTEDFPRKTSLMIDEADDKGKEKNRIVSGTLTYEKFDFWGMEGKTYEVLTEVEQNEEDFSWGLLIPVSQIDLSWTDWEKLGVTAYLKKDFFIDQFDFSLGFSVSGEQTWMHYEEIDDSLAYGCGPVGSIGVNIKGVELTFGVNYLYMANSEYDTVDILTSALNVGIPVKDQFFVNLFTYKLDNFDSDNDYWTYGGSFAYFISDIFHLIGGYNTIQDLDNYESDTFHLGGNWRF